MKRFIFHWIIILVLISSCDNSKVSQINPEVYEKYISVGHDIALEAQKTLLINVSRSMNKGGPLHALEFCHLNALPIIDSLNTACHCKIIRITSNNRNPDNALTNKTDKEVWDFYAHFTSPKGYRDTVLAGEENSIIYYKPITIAIPACLKCHGIPGKDIDDVTAAKIDRLYPDDLATGYEQGDLRGLWKITFSD